MNKALSAMRASVTAIAAIAALAVAPSSLGALLDAPPKLYDFKLDAPSSPRLALLAAFVDASVSVEPSRVRRNYLSGAWARWRVQPWWAYRWQPEQEPPPPAEPSVLLDDDTPSLFGFEVPSPRALTILPEAAPTWLSRIDPEVDLVLPTTGLSFKSNGFDALWVLPPKKPLPNWKCRRRPVRLARYGGESDSFLLVRCDGSVAMEAYDRLTLLAREPTAPRPGDLLPDEPDAAALARGEWTSGVRLVHPRLLWVLQRIADAFPWRTIYIYSGYRHDHEGRARAGGHHSLHNEARALDITVMGIPNAALVKLCRTLPDVGCGYYPNNMFVHVDVRRPGSGHPVWIDVSAPGEPSRYVDAWPGVIEGGALVWDPEARRSEPTQRSSDTDCTRRGIP